MLGQGPTKQQGFMESSRRLAKSYNDWINNELPKMTREQLFRLRALVHDKLYPVLSEEEERRAREKGY